MSPIVRNVALATAVLMTGLAAAAAESPRPEPVVLFDGKTLEGWTKTDFAGSGKVAVEDGAIRLGVGESMTGVTTTRKDLPTTEYELTYEAMRTEGEDFFAAATFPVGKAFLTFVNGGWRGSVTGLSSVDGADASENETGRSFTYKDKTWYRFRVRVTSAVVRCWIDDEKVINLEHEDRHLATRIETRENQPLGFATWESAGAIRHVSVRKLTPAEVAETNKPVQ